MLSLTGLIISDEIPNGEEEEKDDAPPLPLQIGDWVVAQFAFENGKGYKKYVAQIIDITSDKFKLDCLRPKSTQKFSGLVYSYPAVRDNEGCVQKCDIISKIEKPSIFQKRSFKFNVNAKDLL